MNKVKVASELLRIAKSLVADEFDSEKHFDEIKRECRKIKMPTMKLVATESSGRKGSDPIRWESMDGKFIEISFGGLRKLSYTVYFYGGTGETTIFEDTFPFLLTRESPEKVKSAISRWALKKGREFYQVMGRDFIKNVKISEPYQHPEEKSQGSNTNPNQRQYNQAYVSWVVLVERVSDDGVYKKSDEERLLIPYLEKKNLEPTKWVHEQFKAWKRDLWPMKDWKETGKYGKWYVLKTVS